MRDLLRLLAFLLRPFGDVPGAKLWILLVVLLGAGGFARKRSELRLRPGAPVS